MEDQLGALGLVLNALTLWNTVYLDAAISSLHADGYPARDEDIARLSVYVRHHLNVDGHYSFRLPELAGAGELCAIPIARGRRGLTRPQHEPRQVATCHRGR